MYDRKGNLNGESYCDALVDDLDHPSAKFRGRDHQTIRFKQGDVVEIYVPNCGRLIHGVIVATPPTIEEYFEKWKTVEKQCKAEGIGEEYVDDNYSMYDMDDFYKVLYDDFGERCRNIKVWDVFPVSYPFPNYIREDLLSKYRKYMKKHNEDEISSKNDGTVSFEDLLDML